MKHEWQNVIAGEHLATVLQEILLSKPQQLSARAESWRSKPPRLSWAFWVRICKMNWELFWRSWRRGGGRHGSKGQGRWPEVGRGDMARETVTARWQGPSRRTSQSPTSQSWGHACGCDVNLPPLPSPADPWVSWPFLSKETMKTQLLRGIRRNLRVMGPLIGCGKEFWAILARAQGRPQ